MTQCTARMHLYRAGKSYIGQLIVDEDMVHDVNLAPPQRIVIMDHSYSMGQWSGTMLHSVFPQVLSLLGAHPDEHLLVILFNDKASSHHMKVGELQKFEPGRQGQTKMHGVFQELQAQLDRNNPRVQIIALSDGDVHDQAQTVTAAASAADALKCGFEIDARAVRLFTSDHAQPDTRALASVLQLNTHTAATLVDLRTSLALDAMAESMAGMFNESGCRGATLQTDHAVLQLQPWGQPAHQMSVRAGRNTFWLTAHPEWLTLNGEPIEIIEEAPMNQDTMNDILADRLDFFLSQLRVLKVIDTDQAKEQIARIVEYFQNLEASLAPPAELSKFLEGGTLSNRANYLRKTLQRRLKSVTTMMESIAKDDKVRSLNQAQQADYLRQMGTSKNSRALARRAQTAGMDFDCTLRNEILQMKKHLHELSDVDSSNHSVSFYSQASTLEGILEVCKMADDPEVFEGLLAVDLLRLFNVVGVPCVGPISEFPDPMTYRLEQLMAGNFVSVADLSVVELMGSKLKMPGTGVEIVNAVPYFEDLEIQRFLQRHAPCALEYICSIGMRRVLAEVPCTFPYTLVACVWKLIQQLDMDKSEVNIELLCRMMPSYHYSCDGRFEYLRPMLHTDEDPEKSYFIGYNGITNMIAPFWCLAEDGVSKYTPRILRALYTFEAFQVMRRLNKQKDPKFQTEQLDRLLGVDFAAHGTPLPEMFSRPQPVHSQTVQVDREFLAELWKAMSHTKYATIILPLFLAIRKNDPVNNVRAIPEISNKTMAQALDLDYPLEEFMMYNIVEGFLYQSKQSRVDKETNKMLRPDLGKRSVGQEMCHEYILARYREEYEARLKLMAGEEKKLLLNQLIKELLQTDCMETFCHLLSEGIQKGEMSLKIANFTAYGCSELHDALMNMDTVVVKRPEKLQVFYTGEDADNKPVWNGGNMYRTATGPLQKLLVNIGEEATWLQIQKRYKEKVSHVYRGKCSCNRHGHSNGKPSYFAFGHDSLTSFIGAISQEAWAEYQQEHCRCCGVAEAVKDPKGIRLAVERLTAKRAKRKACEEDPSKLKAAIEETMKKRKEKRTLKKSYVPAKRPLPFDSDNSDSNQSTDDEEENDSDY